MTSLINNKLFELTDSLHMSLLPSLAVPQSVFASASQQQGRLIRNIWIVVSISVFTIEFQEIGLHAAASSLIGPLQESDT